MNLHGVARTQVTQGIAQLPQAVRNRTDVKYLALRDIQLLMSCPPQKDGAGNIIKHT